MTFSVSKKLSFFSSLLLFSFSIIGQNNKSLEERLRTNDSLYSIAVKKNNDSLTNNTLGNYVILHYRKKDWTLFDIYRKKHVPYTYLVNDTLGRAKTFKYVSKYFDGIDVTDSAYYYEKKSFDAYNSINDSIQAGFRLLNLAIMRKNSRDYTGSKYKCLLALNYLKGKVKSRIIASIYNTLATNHSELGEYNEAIKYHYKGLALRKEKDSILMIYSLASIGDVHITHKNYKKAIDVLTKTSTFSSSIEKKPKVKAVVLDNLTYARFKNGETENIEELFKKALKIGQEANYVKVQINTLLHLTEYYKHNNNIENAISMAKKAEGLSEQIKSFNTNLRALKFLGILLTGKPSEEKIERYQYLRDSLEIADKKSRDAFHAIDLQVSEKNSLIEEQEDVIKGKTNELYISIGIVITIVIAFVIFFLQKKKQKKELSTRLKFTGNELAKKKVQEKELESKYIYTKSELQKKIKEEEDSLIMIKESKDFEDYLTKKYDLTERGLVLIKLIFESKTQLEQADELNVPESTLKTFKRTKFYPKLNLGWDVVSKQRATAELYSKELRKFNSLKNNQF